MSDIADRKITIGELVDVVNKVIETQKKEKDKAIRQSLAADGGINALHLLFEEIKSLMAGDGQPESEE